MFAQLKNARVAWYPSAGTDFRPLLYLHHNYQTGLIAPPPDVYLFSNICDLPKDCILSGAILRDDSRTRMTVESSKLVQELNLPIHPELVYYEENENQLSNHVYKLNVRVESDMLGVRNVIVFYAFCENTALANKLIQNRIKVSHLIKVGYGAGWGLSKASGAWLLNATRAFKSECLISDWDEQMYTAPLYRKEGDDFAIRLFNSIPRQAQVELEQVDYKMCTGRDTYWYQLSYPDNEN